VVTSAVNATGRNVTATLLTGRFEEIIGATGPPSNCDRRCTLDSSFRIEVADVEEPVE
jgi:hypothetical protein